VGEAPQAGPAFQRDKYVRLREMSQIPAAGRREANRTSAVIMYGAFFMRWELEHQPFEGVGLTMHRRLLEEHD
jgi:hypothetical protein